MFKKLGITLLLSGVFICAHAKDNKRLDSHVALAAAYLLEGNPAVAKEEIQKALDIDSSNAMANNIMGFVQVYYNDNKEARRYFEKAIDLDEENPDIRHNYGWFLCRSNEVDKGIAELIKASVNPIYKTPEKSLIEAANCALKKNDLSSADKYFTKAIMSNPRSMELYLSLAKYHLDYTKKYDLARANFYKLYEQLKNPAPEILWLGIRIEHKLNNQYDEQVLSEKLTKSFPDSSESTLLINKAFDTTVN